MGRDRSWRELAGVVVVAKGVSQAQDKTSLSALLLIHLPWEQCGH